MISSILRRLSTGFALAGGVIVLMIVLMSLVSIIGRKLFSAPVPGDIEVLEMAIAVAVAAFMPICEFTDNHIRVDLIAGLLGSLANNLLISIAHLALAVVAGILAWRTGLLAIDSYAYGSTSTQLALRLWIPQALIVPSLVLLALCAIYRSIHAVSPKTYAESKV